jgi:hypothetical protein
MDSLFTSLRKYRPREKSDPLENFVTEAFAWLLRKDTELGLCFIDSISKKLAIKGKGFTLRSNEVTWSTQENYDSVYPDMEARLSGITLVFEHKVHAPLHDDQLQSYRSFHERMGSEYRLILITGHHSQHDQDPDLALCWYEIYQLIESYIEAKQSNEFTWVVKDFLQLLKTEGLGPAAPISHIGIWHYQEAIELRSQLESLVGRVSQYPWSMNTGYSSEVKNKEGVVGIQFGRINSIGSDKTAWKPGVFIGFVLDGSDHKIRKRQIDGLNMCLNISISKKFHDQYATWPEYKQFVKELAVEVSESKKNWILYNHCEETNPFNAWHPLYLEYPMLDLFKGTSESKEQEERFIGMAEEALKMLASCPAFTSLEKKLS